MPRPRGRFCVGYELPPSLVAGLDAAGMPYVDVRIHPVRLLDDLLFAVRAPHADTRPALLGMALAESEVVVTAGPREAMCQMITGSNLPDDTLLVLGQRPMDATQIMGDQFHDAFAQRLPARAGAPAWAAARDGLGAPRCAERSPVGLADRSHGCWKVAGSRPNQRCHEDFRTMLSHRSHAGTATAQPPDP